MTEVSEKFRELALEHGRRVWCRVVADGVEFRDDTLLELEFDDVVHPDWFTIGTACANRLHFTARFSGELAAGAEVGAFISFDGEEWCSLGIFYITRRYVRGKYISVTAYDRMYFLDEPYSYGGQLPTTCTDILADISVKFGLELGDVGYGYTVKTLPSEETTVRDMLGYLAAMNCRCAKLDRNGALVFKGLDMLDFTLTDSSCFEHSRNMTRSVVTCLKAQTESELLTVGNGAEISTIELYNPIMDITRPEQIHSQLKPFFYYGAELEMQGMPFLEAGDGLYFLDEVLLYPLVISEMVLRYDGGLTATLYSRNRIEAELTSFDDLESVLEELKRQHNVFAVKSVNALQLQLTEEPQQLAELSFSASEGGFAQLDVNMTLRGFTASGVEFLLYVNGAEQPRKPLCSLSEGDTCIVHLHELVDKLSEGDCVIRIAARANDGEAYIFAGELSADAVVHGGAPLSGDVLRIRLSEALPLLSMSERRVGLLQLSGSCSAQTEDI